MKDTDHFRSLIIGDGALPLECCRMLAERGQEIAGVITADPFLSTWVAERSIPHLVPDGDVIHFASRLEFDYLFSIVNLSILPEMLLEMPRLCGINFHDGPLPGYAGVHVPAWAILKGESKHAVTWHTLEKQVDSGDILFQEAFDIAPDDTSFTLNVKCFEAGLRSFPRLLQSLSAQGPRSRTPQSQGVRTLYRKHQKPYAGGCIDWTRPAADLSALVRATVFGLAPNGLASAKLLLGKKLYVVHEVRILPSRSGSQPGTVVALTAAELVVTTGSNDIAITKLVTPSGMSVTVEEALVESGCSAGDSLCLIGAQADELQQLCADASRAESFWVTRCLDSRPLDVAIGESLVSGSPLFDTGPQDAPHLPSDPSSSSSGIATQIAGLAAFFAQWAGKPSLDLGFLGNSPAAEPACLFVEPVLPLRIDVKQDLAFGELVASVAEEVRRVEAKPLVLRDLGSRYPALRGLSPNRTCSVVVGVSDDLAHVTAQPGAAVTIWLSSDAKQTRWVGRGGLEVMYERWLQFTRNLQDAGQSQVSKVSILGRDEERDVTLTWNATQVAFDPNACIHTLFEDQARRTPQATALIYRGHQVTYDDLNQRANRLAAKLIQLGVGPDTLVGVCMNRCIEMVVGLLGILKAGGAYVPLDPQYPRDRLALMIEDTGLSVVLTAGSTAENLQLPVRHLERVESEEPNSVLPSLDIPRSVSGSNLAYVMYTSGSTGKPKGVMIEHRNAVNFFVGIDQVLGSKQPGTWLAVTSISFDISVLELFWTLTRGFKVVLADDESRLQVVTTAPRHTDRKLSFSLFYFATNEEDPAEGNRYRLLLEGARYADANGFSAVWTPERHFHAFGGLYPNPSVTSAAVAVITRNVAIRAGSVVLPLHHPIRVAEEWSVVDNLSGGRVAISFAAGWNERDFVFAPDKYSNAKQIMLRDIETVKKLWRGESIEENDGKGKQVEIKILPRPIQRELPVWLTAAGNPDTFRAAGESGANILTHLLGQNIEDLSSKIDVYRKARKDAGHAGEGQVTLMLHSFVAPDPAFVRDTIRSPFTHYLKTSVDLIKTSPWSFPAFARRGNAAADKPLSLTDLTPEELDALLTHAFDRYSETSGLFGTPEQCIAFARKLQNIGVDEIACLIDFGVSSEVVLQHLPYLKQVQDAIQAPQTPAEDESLPALMERYQVTHLQCTPSMGRMLTDSPDARAALRNLKTMLVGGEALPVDLAEQLAELVPEVHNMYGPTETTVWSTTHRVTRGGRTVPIGRPIANTEILILDEQQRPVPIDMPGELMIGGEGVARGYFKRPDLTSERFIQHPSRPGAKLYRTGDLARWTPGGILEYLGRIDDQVKIRGHRIEMGEIEAAIAQDPSVRQVVVTAQAIGTGADQMLVAYIVPQANAGIDTLQIRKSVEQVLPQIMVPSAFVVLERIPLTPNGKIDRKALPALNNAAAQASRAPAAGPTSELEQKISAVWQQVLGLEQIGVNENFFDLGGHSISMVQAHVKLREVVKSEITLIDMFRFPTVGALASYIHSKLEPTSAVSNADDRVARRIELRRSRLGHHSS